MASGKKNCFQIRIYDSIISDLEQHQQQLPPAAERQQQAHQHPNQQQQQPEGGALENWDACDSLTYVPRPGPPVRSKAERRRARRERQRMYGRGQPQRPRSPEPGRPIAGQNQISQDMGWLEEYIRNREAKRTQEEEQAGNDARIINIIL